MLWYLPYPFMQVKYGGLIAMNISEPRAIIESTPSHPPTGDPVSSGKCWKIDFLPFCP